MANGADRTLELLIRTRADLAGTAATNAALKELQTQGTATLAATATTDETCCAPSVNLGNQYGDYEGIAALGGVVRPVWTDRRAGVIALGLREEVFVASITPGP